jgi:hypothetical protein
MGTDRHEAADWPRALRRYLGLSLVANLGWEIVQLPLYTLWSTGTFKQRAFAVIHCTIGDAMIAGLALILALAVFARPTWPRTGLTNVSMSTFAFGIVYTVYSEWLNVSVRGSWAYSDLMPILPVIGTGLAPLLQWIVIPTLALWVASGRSPWICDW